MKPYYLALILFISCSKSQNTFEKPVEKSITYQIQKFDTKHNLIEIDTSIHWCRVSGDELKPFLETTRTDELICDGTGNRLVLIIGEPCLTEHKKY